MGPAIYSLCQKPVIGAVMWMATLCAFPPLISRLPLSLEEAQATATSEFTVPVDKVYQLELEFEFPTVQARLQDRVAGTRFDESCLDEAVPRDPSWAGRAGAGRVIPLRLVIRRQADRAVVIDRTFQSRCALGHADRRKWRAVGAVELARGDYLAQITNLQPQDGLDGVRTTASLTAGQGK